jgi:hypothetical protein
MCCVDNLDNLPHPTSEGKFCPHTTKSVQADVFILVFLTLFDGAATMEKGSKPAK